MQINILAFGQVASVTGANLVLTEEIIDSDGLKLMLQKRYPELCTLKFAIAVDKQIINGNVPLLPDCTIALLPPFSGG